MALFLLLSCVGLAAAATAAAAPPGPVQRPVEAGGGEDLAYRSGLGGVFRGAPGQWKQMLCSSNAGYDYAPPPMPYITSTYPQLPKNLVFTGPAGPMYTGPQAFDPRLYAMSNSLFRGSQAFDRRLLKDNSGLDQHVTRDIPAYGQQMPARDNPARLMKYVVGKHDHPDSATNV